MVFAIVKTINTIDFVNKIDRYFEVAIFMTLSSITVYFCIYNAKIVNYYPSFCFFRVNDSCSGIYTCLKILNLIKLIRKESLCID